MSDDHFLARWSRRKHAAVKGEPVEIPPPGTQEGSAMPAVSAEPAVPAPLPPVESLTPDSDFSPFMGADVDELLRRRALKTLFQDPRFNVMDGLDVYIDDYSKPDPLPPEWLAQMNQMKHLGHYIEKALETVEPKSETAAGELQNVIPEQSVAPDPAEVPVDTAANETPARE